jgi:hypothetical protein
MAEQGWKPGNINSHKLGCNDVWYLSFNFSVSMTIGHFLKKAGEKLNHARAGDTDDTSPNPPLASTPPTPSQPPAPSAAELEHDDIIPRGSASLSMRPFFAAESEPFYLNIVVVDSAQAVQEKLDAKLGKGFWSNQASKLAKKVVSESTVAAKVAAQLSEKVHVCVSGLSSHCFHFKFFPFPFLSFNIDPPSRG